MKFKYFFIACCLYLLIAEGVSAEYYQYVDKNGVKQFTDTLSDVPEDQRPNLHIFQSVKPSAEKTLPKAEPDPEETGSAITHEALLIKKEALEKEYEALVQKREALNEQKKTLDEEKYNASAVQLNLEIQQYQERKESYDMLVEQYNAQINASTETDDTSSTEEK